MFVGLTVNEIMLFHAFQRYVNLEQSVVHARRRYPYVTLLTKDGWHVIDILCQNDCFRALSKEETVVMGFSHYRCSGIEIYYRA